MQTITVTDPAGVTHTRNTTRSYPWAIIRRNAGETNYFVNFAGTFAAASREARVQAETRNYIAVVETTVAAPAEPTQAERSAAVGAWLEGTIEAIRAATPQDAIKKGDVVTLIADGLGWTVRRINKDGSLRLINEEGTKINRKPSAVTK